VVLRRGEVARPLDVALYEAYADQRPSGWPASGVAALTVLAARRRAATLAGDVARLQILAEDMRAITLSSDPAALGRARRRALGRAINVIRGARRMPDTRRPRPSVLAICFHATSCAESTAIYYYAQRHGRAPSHRLVPRVFSRDAKTEAGVREVHLSPWLVQELSDYFASLPVRPAGGDPAFPTRRGGRRDKNNIRNRVLRPALAKANEMRAKEKVPPITVRLTPHTLRRTYASLLLTANAEPQRVIAQLGHTDPSMTLRLYAQVLRRRDSIKMGEDFDRLITGALSGGRLGSAFATGQDAESNRRCRARFDRA
jgi:integrase